MGLVTVAGARDPVVSDGGILDTKQALAPLTTEETKTERLRDMQAELRAGVAEEATIKRQRHAERVREKINQRGEDEASTSGLVERMLDADARGVLTGRHLLHLDDGHIVSVKDVITDREAYHRVTCADPLEPDYGGGTNKAILFTDGRHPRVYSHAHGGRLFTLALNEADVTAAVQAAQDEGQDPAKVARTIAPDIIFAALGWSAVEAASGWRIADAPDVGAMAIRTIPGSLLSGLGACEQ